MRKHFVFAVILIASALTATAADVTGKWDGTLTRRIVIKVQRCSS